MSMYYIFNGKHHDGNNYDICIGPKKSLADAWEVIAVHYPEFTEVTFVREEKEED